MPKLGLEMEEGTILDWHVEEGGDVAEGDVLSEIESEKSVGEIEAREDGVLHEILTPEGETVEPGTAIGVVGGPDEDISSLLEDVEGETADVSDDAGDAETDGEATADSTAAESTSSASGSTGETQQRSPRIRASPRAKRKAEDLGVDLTTIDGTGPGGAITTDDVEQAAAAGAPGTGDDDTDDIQPTVEEERSLGGMRETIATRLGESYQNAVHVTINRHVDAEELLAAADAADTALDEDVSSTDVLLLAISATLDAHPEFNATFEDGVHRLYENHNICVAVDVEDGLLAPAVRNVDRKDIETLATDRRELTKRVLDGNYTSDDLTGGTFTVSNLGMFGVESFDPIINPPQVAILGVNAFVDRPVQEDGSVHFRKQLPLSLSFDHRIVDGADAARFLQTLAEHVESPWGLLIGRDE